MKHSVRTAALLGLALLSLSLDRPAAAQVKQRLVPFPVWASSPDDDEEIRLELVEISVAGKPVVLGQPFDADENWLKEMTLRVKNVGSKPITTFGIRGGLLTEADEGLPPSASLRYGIAWGWGEAFDPEKGKPEGPVLAPGEIVELSYENTHPRTRQVLAKEGEGAFHKLTFAPPGIQYADGTEVTTSGVKFPGRGKP